MNGTSVSGSPAQAQLPAGVLSVGQAFEYRVEHCDGTGCATSALATGYVSPDLGAGSRPGATRVPFTVGDRVTASVDVGSGNLLVTTSELAVPRLSGQLGFGLVYNSAARQPGSRSTSATMVSPGWSTRTGADVRLVLDTDNSTITYFGPDGRTGVFTPITADPNTYTSPAGFKMTLTRAERLDAAGPRVRRHHHL